MATTRQNVDLDKVLSQWRRDHGIDDAAYNALLQTVSSAGLASQRRVESDHYSIPLLLDEPVEPASNFKDNYNDDFNDVHTSASSTSAEPASTNFNPYYNINFNQVDTMATSGGSITNDTQILDHDQFVLPDDLEYLMLPETTFPINHRLARESTHLHGFVEVKEPEADELEKLNLPDREFAMASNASNANQLSAPLLSEPCWNIIPAAVANQIQCIKCWYDRRECEGGSPCRRCLKAQTDLPQSFCVRVRFADQSVFSKWKVPSYEKKLVWESLIWISHTKIASLGHDPDGPRLSIRCHEFLTYDESQVRLFWKSETGWNWVPTTAYTMQSLGIMNELDLYIRQYATYYLQKAIEGDDPLSHIFKMANHFTDRPIIQLSLRIWSANRLLMQGWSILDSDELLGMSVINEPASLLHKTVPAPKVIQNQLDHLLERQIFEIEESLLKELQKLIRRRDRGQWIVVFLSLVIVLHVLERDIWRLVYWVHHKQEANTWRHPLKPIKLIDKSIYLSNLLIAHYYYAAAGSLPLELDWSAPGTSKAVDDNAAVVHSMQTLQIHTRNLRRNEMLGRKGREVYTEKSDKSLDFTLSSLVLLKELGTFADLKDFVPVQ